MELEVVSIVPLTPRSRKRLYNKTFTQAKRDAKKQEDIDNPPPTKDKQPLTDRQEYQRSYKQAKRAATKINDASNPPAPLTDAEQQILTEKKKRKRLQQSARRSAEKNASDLLIEIEKQRLYDEAQKEKAIVARAKVS